MIDKTKLFLFIIIVVLISACSTTKQVSQDFGFSPTSKEKPLVTFIQTEGIRTDTQKQIEIVTDYTKIPFDKVSIRTYNQNSKVEPSTRLICISNTYDLNDSAIDSLHNFVARGGRLFFTNVVSDERVAFLMGMDPRCKFDKDLEANGYFFKTDVLPKSKGGRIVGSFSNHEGFKGSNFSDEVKVLAIANNNKDYPVLLEHKVGKGKVIIHNSSDAFYKETRGVLFSMLLLGIGEIPYPVPNIANIHLDDFPAPVYKIFKEPVKSNLNIDMADFVTDVWWPDMKELAVKYNLVYTAYPAFDYNFRVTPPFVFTEWERNKTNVSGYEEEISNWLGRDLINSGHEMGFHGYNHVSLTKDEWKNPEYIVSALSSARKKWKTANFGEFPISYVPPSNIIDSIGLQKLQEGIPSLRYLQSVYSGSYEEGGDREFGPEKWNLHFFSFPRVSSGYLISDDLTNKINSLFLITGIWTHFVHPDDVFQIPSFASNIITRGNYEFRNKYNLPWRSMNGKVGLLENFEIELKKFKSKYPLTRFVTAKRGSEITANWRYAYYYHEERDGLYTVYSDDFYTDTNNPHYWFMYVEEKNDKKYGKDLIDIATDLRKTKLHDGYLYQIETSDAFIAIPSHDSNDYGEDFEVKEFVNNERKLFERNRNDFLPIIMRLEKLEIEGSYNEATNLIESQISKGIELSKAQWKHYAELMMWQEKGEQLWDFFESDYLKDQQISKIYLAFELENLYGYPNSVIKKKWYERAIAREIADLTLLRAYLDEFNNEDNVKNVKTVLKSIFSTSKTSDDKMELVKFLLYSNDDELLELLKDTKACDKEYSHISDEIAWYLADRFEFDLAHSWSSCTLIDQETKEYWFQKSDKFEGLKYEDPYSYYGIVMNVDPKRAYQELSQINVCQNDLMPLANKIAELFGDYKDYKGAISWSECTDQLPLKKLLIWNYEIKRYQKMYEIYEDYINEHPDDIDLKYHMATLLMYMGKIAKAAEIIVEIKSGKYFNELRGKINRDIQFLKINEQINLVGHYPNLFSEKTKTRLKEESRLQMGNDIFFSGNSTNDRLDPTMLNFLAGYSLSGKKHNLHSLAVVRGFAYPINFITMESENLKRDFIGLEYSFMNERGRPNNFSTSLRIERDNVGKTFFHMNMSLGRSFGQNFISGQLAFKPVQTGPGYVREIYVSSMDVYSEIKVSKTIELISALEGFYFTDKEFSTIIIGRLQYDILKNNKNLSLYPLAEISYGIASDDRRDGFPYWIATNRFLAAGGIALKIGEEDSKLYLDTSVSLFYENQDEPNFERYLGNVNFRISKYFTLKAGVEFYTIENFFSNAFNLGLRYHLPFRYKY